MDFMKLRTALGITLLILVSLFSNVRLLKPADRFLYRLTGIGEIVPDDMSRDVTRYEKRLEGLKHALPSHGVVGYVTGTDSSGVSAHMTYLTVQYVLAPLIVKNGPDHPLVVGNFSGLHAQASSFLHDNHLTILKDFGDGVFLLRNEAK